MTGRWRARKARNTFCIQRRARNPFAAMGVFRPRAPRSESADHYVYDPANPVPTMGGPLCCDAVDIAAWSARSACGGSSRRRADLHHAGVSRRTRKSRVRSVLNLFAKSSAVDTDFTAKLVDVGPDGFAQNLTEGIIRARYRDSQEKASLMNPGQVYKFNIDLWSTSNVFLERTHAAAGDIAAAIFPASTEI